MKFKKEVRPALTNIIINNKTDRNYSVGDVLRAEKRKLMITKIAYVIIAVLMLLVVIVAFSTGLVSELVDKFFALLA